MDSSRNLLIMTKTIMSEEDLKLLILKLAIQEDYDKVQEIRRKQKDSRRCTRCSRLRKAKSLIAYKEEKLCSGCYNVSKARETPLPVPKERPPEPTPTTLQKLLNPKDGSQTVTVPMEELENIIVKIEKNLEAEARIVNSRNRSVSKQIWKGRS